MTDGWNFKPPVAADLSADESQLIDNQRVKIIGG
jgi:hypothetical protein